LGARLDYNNNHGAIFTPRLAYKWKLTTIIYVRFNTGTGFRIVNLFTEEHAALTGSREVIVLEELKPERSYNANLNYLKKMYTKNGTFIGLETRLVHPFFQFYYSDYDSNPTKLSIKNLNGLCKGVSTNVDLVFNNEKNF
jgi:outer membrane receptor for ferrienterochelin and colicins